MTLASTLDIESSLLRELTANETTYAPALLARAETMLIAHAPTLLVDADVEHDYRETVVSIEADMIARVFRNPDGIIAETQGQYGYRLNLDVSSGRLSITDEELGRLHRSPLAGAALGAVDGYARQRYGVESHVHRFLRA